MVCDRVIVLFLVAVAGTTYAMRLNGGERNRREGENQESPLFRELPDLNFEGNFEDSPLAREESQGFIIGRPSNFPSFESVGGFGPMDVEQKSEMNFVQEFEMPSVSFPDLDEKQPKIGPENFPNQQLLE
ncbi:UNVERIFIED_CONTAM: hypothetical protein RMT77_012862 [Armadillidium vulgare]